MTYDSQKYHRRSIRLKGYDYSQAGLYYITVCVQDRACLFGEVVGDGMHLNDAGRMVLAEWDALPVRFPAVELDAFVVMPNHVHGIFVVTTAGAVARQAPVGATLVVALDLATADDSHSPTAGAGGARATTRVAPTGAPASPAQVTAVPAPSIPATPAPAPPAPAGASPVPTVGDILGAFKSLTTVAYGQGVKHAGWPGFRGRLWQRNYHEHIIRNEESLNRIRRYILDNPACWASDEENPQVERPKKKKA